MRMRRPKREAIVVTGAQLATIRHILYKIGESVAALDKALRVVITSQPGLTEDELRRINNPLRVNRDRRSDRSPEKAEADTLRDSAARRRAKKAR
jgi:hypothetical protein